MQESVPSVPHDETGVSELYSEFGSPEIIHGGSRFFMGLLLSVCSSCLYPDWLTREIAYPRQ
jgi:hypothetical protein